PWEDVCATRRFHAGLRHAAPARGIAAGAGAVLYITRRWPLILAGPGRSEPAGEGCVGQGSGVTAAPSPQSRAGEVPFTRLKQTIALRAPRTLAAPVAVFRLRVRLQCRSTHLRSRATIT